MQKVFQTTVNTLKIGDAGTIEKITAPSELKERLLSLGFIKGNSIRLISSSLAKETFVVNVGKKSQYALRSEEAKHILVSVNT